MSHLINKISYPINIGNETEFGVETHEFDISSWLAVYPDLVCGMTMKIDDDTPFPLTGVSVADGILTWVVGEEATASSGNHSIVVYGEQTGVRKCSKEITVVVAEGHEAAGEAPDAVANWIAEATVSEAARSAAEAERVTAEEARASFTAYDGGTSYVIGEKVSYQGSSYIWTSTTPSVAGTAPPDTGWLLIAQRGSTLTAMFTIDWDTGILSVTYPDDYVGLTFSISESGELEVVIE